MVTSVGRQRIGRGWLLVESSVYWDSSYRNVVRTLKDQWFALALGATALIALFWLELLAT
jgi:hypothetical protein